MASDVDICNAALNNIGATNIISLTEDSKAARVCNQRYPIVRDAVFRTHPWNCLIRRLELAQGATPSYEYAYSYPLPNEPFCLRVLEVDGEASGVTYVVEGRSILSDEGTMKIKYISRVLDANEYDTLLIEALAARLSSELAYPLANSTSLQAQLFNIYEHKISAAQFVDATEGTPAEVTSTYFTDARL
jgi:hypothetical protein